MIPTVPIDIAVNVAVGCSFVLASRNTVADESLLRSAALWALVAFEVLLFVPVGAYLLVYYPDWSLMYIVAPGQLPVPDWALVATYPIAAFTGFVVARGLVIKGRIWTAIGFMASGFLLSLAVTGFGYRQLMNVGTTNAYRNGGSLEPILTSQLAYLLGAIFLAIGAGWVICIWRLDVLGRAWRRKAVTFADG